MGLSLVLLLSTGIHLFVVGVGSFPIHSGNLRYVTRETPVGSIKGLRQTVLGREVEYFLGIPFAKPPVGERRFRRPEGATPWEGILDATRLPPSCHQLIDQQFGRFAGVDMWNPNTNMSEDCLYLNIWQPVGTSDRSDRAVMVWVYGGGFYSGTSTLDVYDGRILAAKTDVVVVSMQYRVGPLGFLYLGVPEVPGNQGLLDQQLAIQWIYNHIQAFGGDHQRITLFGESAGAASTSLHLLSPLSKSLVRSAIMQSGSAVCPWAVDPPHLALQRGMVLAKHVDCSGDGSDSSNVQQSPSIAGVSPELLRCLHDVKPATFSDEQWSIRDVGSALVTPLVATVDNYFLNEMPFQTLARGAFKRESILLGVNHDEGTVWLAYGQQKHFALEFNDSLSKQDYLDVVRDILNADKDLIVENVAFEYGAPYSFDEKRHYREVLDDMFGDLVFKCPVVEFSLAYARSQLPVFVYQFNHRSSANPWPAWMGVMHGYEIDHVFGLPFNETLRYTREERELSDRMLTYWSNFAKTGNPNLFENGSLVEFHWPAYTVDQRRNLVLNTPSLSVVSGLRDRQCDYWRDIVPRLRAVSAVINAHEGETGSSRTDCHVSSGHKPTSLLELHLSFVTVLSVANHLRQRHLL